MMPWRIISSSVERTGRKCSTAANRQHIRTFTKEDKLGLDVIYIQAKRWQGAVGRPEVQKFVGALHGKRAKKGVFITMGSFTKDAEQ